MAERPLVDRTPDSLAIASEAATVAAQRWGLPTPTPLRMGMNALFSAGDVVLRVGRLNAPASVALALADVLAGAGVRAPVPVRAEAVDHGDLSVTAWERIEAVDGEVDWSEVGRMVARVHELTTDDLPVGYPMPPCETFPWWQFDDLLAEVATELDPAAREGLVATIERHRGWSEGVARVVSHGDVHPGNVVMTVDGPVLLDWDLLCVGPAAWDHAMLLRLPRWGWPASWYDDFARGYGRSVAGDTTAEAIADLRLVAATLMRVRAATTDPAARPEAEQRLRWWRGDHDAPPWIAV